MVAACIIITFGDELVRRSDPLDPCPVLMLDETITVSDSRNGQAQLLATNQVPRLRHPSHNQNQEVCIPVELGGKGARV